MTQPTFYQVGGAVRDKFLGIAKPKDVDFCVPVQSFQELKAAVEAKGWDIKVEEADFFRIRAVAPVFGGVDVVVCRQDGYYADGRRPDSVMIGTLTQDLARRDFTVNAMAQAEDGTLTDLFDGRADLDNRILRCVGNTAKRMSEDSLRILRALRFQITKGFMLAPELESFLLQPATADLLQNLSMNRVRDELLRCFEFDSLETLRVLEKFWRIRNHVFSRNLTLKPTVK